MPELPEVETVVRGLRGPLVGRTFTDVTVLWSNAIKTPIPELEADLPGRQIEAISRRGKYLLFHLSGDKGRVRNFRNSDKPEGRRGEFPPGPPSPPQMSNTPGGKTLLLHLKMSGDLLVEPADAPRHLHVRTVFGLDNGHQLRFKDMRKFGRVYLVDDPQTVVGRLGPEPLADDFSVGDFKALFNRRSGRLKPLLLNQEFIAGIGNIYADESCFLAGLNPRRPVDTLTDEEKERLYHAIRQSLQHGIMHKGASLDAVYRGGEFQYHFQAYGRTGEPCLICGAAIVRIVLGGRSTHFCSRCQQ